MPVVMARFWPLKAGDREQIDLSIIENLTISFEEIADFGKDWEFLDDTGKMAKIQAIVKEIRVLADGQDSIEVDSYTETFKNLPRTPDRAS